jgi:glycosyltransferase involved in cell wall biosynthesis
MRICMVAASFYPAVVYGGPIFSSYNAVLNLAKNDRCSVVVLTTNANEGRPLEVELNKKVSLGIDCWCIYFAQSFKSFFPFNLLRGFFDEIRHADVVHIQAIFNYTTIIALVISCILGKPIVLSPRGCLGDWAMSHRKVTKALWIRLFIAPVAKRIVFHATSIQEQDEVRAMFGDVITVVIPNGITQDEFDDIQMISKRAFAESFCFTTERFTNETVEVSSIIVSMARLHPKKGLDILISAFAEYLRGDPQAILAIAGPDDGDRSRLEDLAVSMGVSSRVFFVGMLYGSKRLEFLANADVFVLPSHNENFGNVYLESLLAGTPIVASKNTPWGLVEEHNCGRWSDISVEAVCKSIQEVMELDPLVSVRCKGVAAKFTWESIANSFIEEYQRLT